MRNLSRAIGLVLLLARAVLAGLEWESQDFHYTATPQDKQVRAVFALKNTGTGPITITQVKTSCGCSTAELKKRLYAPGEQGQLEVLFEFGNRMGKQIKTVQVNSDDPEQPTQTLTLHVDIPDLFTVRPKFVYWSATDPKTAKKVTVEFDHQSPAHIRSVQADQAVVTAQVQTVEAGTRYEVWLTPVPADQPVRELVPVMIVSDLPYERFRKQIVYVRVARHSRKIDAPGPPGSQEPPAVPDEGGGVTGPSMP